MILGRKARPPIRIGLSKIILTVCISGVVILGLIFLVLLLDDVNNRFHIAKLEAQRKNLVLQNARLVERGREKDQQLALLSDKMRDIELTLERIEQVEGRIRLLSGMSEDPLITENGPVTRRIDQTATTADVANLYSSAKDIMDRMDTHGLSLRKVAKYFAEQRSEILQVPALWPLRGWVTSVFGMRTSPFTGKPAMHKGMDIAAPEGKVIRAPASGTVIFKGRQSGYGNVLVLRHGRGITTLFGHLSKSLLEEGDRISIGTPIALVGNTGRSTGPHLHYEVRLNNIPVNPQRFLPKDRDEQEVAAAVAAEISVDDAPSLWPSEPIPAQEVKPISPIPPTNHYEIDPQ